MSDSQSLPTYNVTFKTEQVYEEYKQKVIAAGGTIKADYGKILRGFSFVISPATVSLIFSGNFQEKGIDSFDVDGVAKTQAGAQ